MSLAGHLALVVVLITSVAIFVHRAEMVTPDQIQIMEIDLSNVKITGDETKLYNTDAPKAKQDTQPKEGTKSAPAPEPVAAKNDKSTDGFVDDDTAEKTRKTPKNLMCQMQMHRKRKLWYALIARFYHWIGQ